MLVRIGRGGRDSLDSGQAVDEVESGPIGGHMVSRHFMVADVDFANAVRETLLYES